MDPDNDKRFDERVATLWEVEVEEPLHGREYKFQAKDLSRSGIFLVTTKTRKFRVGESVKMRIHLHGREYPLVMSGEIMRIVDKAESQRTGDEAGLGIEFHERQVDIPI